MDTMTAKLLTHFCILVLFSDFPVKICLIKETPGKTAQILPVFPGASASCPNIRVLSYSLLRKAAGVIPVIFLNTLEK